MDIAAATATIPAELEPYLHLVPGLPCRITWRATAMGREKINSHVCDDLEEAAERIMSLVTSRFGSCIPCVEALDQLPEPQVADHTLTGPTVTVTVPHRFYDDHCDRGAHPGQIIKTMTTGVRVMLDAAAYDDLLSDATYYSDAKDFGRDYAGLCASARATVQRLIKVGRPA